MAKHGVPFKRGLICLLLVAAGLVGGCTKKIYVRRYPAWYSPDLKAIAVVPFYNATGQQNRPLAISNELIAALRSNGTYRVYDQDEIRTAVGADAYLAFLGLPPKAMAERLASTIDVQAMLSGTVTLFDQTSRTERITDEEKVWDPQRSRWIYTGRYKIYDHTRNAADVTVSGKLYRVPEGVVLHATASAIHAERRSEGSPPKLSADECFRQAVDEVIGKLVAEFAVAVVPVVINTKKDFRLARGKDGVGKWIEADKFAPTDEEMFVVLRLPAVCDRNAFRVVIVPKGDDATLLADHEIRWQRGWSDHSIRLDPRELTAKTGGPGKYEARFYYGHKLVTKRGFSIVAPKPK